MNNIAGSLVESYMYADMYNREGGDPERIHVGGAPVNYMVSSLNINDEDKDQMNGGNKKTTGKLTNKVVPAGLVVIQIRREPNVEFEEQRHPQEVVPHELFERLFENMQKSSSRKYENRRKTPTKRGSITNKKRSRKST
jgi:hypothetical protein